MNYCSHCGSDALNWIIPKGDNRPRIVCSNCNTIHYTNPKIIAGCLPVWNDQVLLCKRAIEPCYGSWNLPAGYMENGESVEQGAQREMWEEALAKVTIKGVHCIFSIPQINQVYIHFLAELVDGKFGVGVESLESELFYEHEIPWEDIAFSSSRYALKRYFEDRKSGQHKTHIGLYKK